MLQLHVLSANSWQTCFAQIDLKRANIKIKDGGSNEIDVKIGEGNLTYTERRTIEYVKDRGNLDLVREGDQEPVDVSFEFTWEYISGYPTTDGLPSIEDALKRTGEAAAWESTDSDQCNPYAVDLEVTYSPTPVTCGDMETITLTDFRYEELSHDLRAGTISVSGKCNVVEATVVRAANSSGALD